MITFSPDPLRACALPQDCRQLRRPRPVARRLDEIPPAELDREIVDREAGDVTLPAPVLPASNLGRRNALPRELGNQDRCRSRPRLLDGTGDQVLAQPDPDAYPQGRRRCRGGRERGPRLAWPLPPSASSRRCVRLSKSRRWSITVANAPAGHTRGVHADPAHRPRPGFTQTFEVPGPCTVWLQVQCGGQVLTVASRVR